jgi:hypothetical protein
MLDALGVTMLVLGAMGVLHELRSLVLDGEVAVLVLVPAAILLGCGCALAS